MFATRARVSKKETWTPVQQRVDVKRFVTPENAPCAGNTGRKTKMAAPNTVNVSFSLGTVRRFLDCGVGSRYFFEGEK